MDVWLRILILFVEKSRKRFSSARYDRILRLKYLNRWLKPNKGYFNSKTAAKIKVRHLRNYHRTYLLTCICCVGRRLLCVFIINLQALRAIIMSLTKRKNSPEKEELIENGDTMTDSGPSNIKGDEVNISVLLFLYTLQGIPLGLAAAVPMLLQNRGITYTQQVRFCFITWRGKQISQGLLLNITLM